MLDVQEQLEMAMLDKEVAEERAEVAEAELEELKEKLAVAEVELDVMKEKEQNEGLVVEEGTDPQVSGSLAYIQLEKQNARLKEALVRYVSLFLKSYAHTHHFSRPACAILLPRPNRKTGSGLQKWRRISWTWRNSMVGGWF